MDSITLKKIVKNKNKITYHFTIPNELVKHFNEEYIDSENNVIMFLEMPHNVNVEDVPGSILSIPFVGTMIGISMIYNSSINVDVIDKRYFESLKEIEKTFRIMYPKGSFNLNVNAKQIVETLINQKESKSAVFFTGGVDATSALVGNIAEKPLLINIDGADIGLANSFAHNKLNDYFDRIKENLDLDYCFVRTNCREIFREYSFDKIFRKFISREMWWGYWASVAHVIVMTAIIAPIAYSYNITRSYIGSSHSSNDDAYDGNNEKLINAIYYYNCDFISADAYLDRNDKVNKIVKYSKESQVYFDLQVCWNKKEGLNCCRCEKCYRTMMNILSAHGDPNRFALKYDKNIMNDIKLFLKSTPIKTSYWLPTQNVFKRERNEWENTELSWFIDFRFNSIRAYINKAVNLLKQKFRK